MSVPPGAAEAGITAQLQFQHRRRRQCRSACPTDRQRPAATPARARARLGSAARRDALRPLSDGRRPGSPSHIRPARADVRPNAPQTHSEGDDDARNHPAPFAEARPRRGRAAGRCGSPAQGAGQHRGDRAAISRRCRSPFRISLRPIRASATRSPTSCAPISSARGCSRRSIRSSAAGAGRRREQHAGLRRLARASMSMRW